MSTNDEAHRSPYQIVEEEKSTYLNELPPPDLDWPPDVRLLLETLHAHLFDSDLRVRDIRNQIGLRDNNVSGCFRYYVGRTPRAYVIHHRIELAKQLLATTEMPVGDVARGMGWDSPGAFSTTFKQHIGEPPSGYRRQIRSQKRRGNRKEC